MAKVDPDSSEAQPQSTLVEANSDFPPGFQDQPVEHSSLVPPTIESFEENLPTDVVVDFFPDSPLSISSGASTIFNPDNGVFQDFPDEVSISSFDIPCFSWTDDDTDSNSTVFWDPPASPDYPSSD